MHADLHMNVPEPFDHFDPGIVCVCVCVCVVCVVCLCLCLCVRVCACVIIEWCIIVCSSKM